MRCLAAVLALLLLLAACGSQEERDPARAKALDDSLLEATRARPVVPLEYEDVRMGPLFSGRDSLRAAPDSAAP